MSRCSIVALAVLGGCASMDTVHLVGGTVYDGSGGEGQRLNVALREDRIAKIGDLSGRSARRVIDAQGLIVCPGFIDLHTHSDEPILKPDTRDNLNYLTQGCTTIVTGNCGSGPTDVAAYFDAIEREGAGSNVIHLIPHGFLREQEMGNIDREPTPQELERMKAVVEKGLQSGAWGMSTGLIYSPGMFAKTTELVQLARVVAEAGGIYASHIRGEGEHLLEAVNEAILIGKESACPVHISHFKAASPPAWGKIREAAQWIETARKEGLRVTADQYPYTASSTSLSAMFLPAWAREGTPAEVKAHLDGAESMKIREHVQKGLVDRGGPQTVILANFEANPGWNGKSLETVASETGRDAVDVVLDVLRKGGASAVSFSMCEEDVRFAMKLSYVATASDGAAKIPGPDRPHPRSYGTFPRKIGRYALEEGVVSLAHAIRSSTGLPAEILGLRERGFIREGYAADLVIFDPETFRDRATYADPHQYSTGVRYLFVNGTIVIDDGRFTGALTGRVLRHNLLDYSKEVR